MQELDVLKQLGETMNDGSYTSMITLIIPGSTSLSMLTKWCV